MVGALREKILSHTSTWKWWGKIEKFLSGRAFLIALAVFIFFVQALGLDMLGFGVLVLLVSLICVFGKNTNACVPIICMAIFCVSIWNSPTKYAHLQVVEGKPTFGEPPAYYSSTYFIVFACIAAVILAAAVIFRLIVFGDFNRAFGKKGLLGGIGCLSLGFLISGCGVNFSFNSVFFALIQAATFFLVYLFFVSTTDFKTFTIDYVMDVLLSILFYIITLLIFVYAMKFWAFTKIDSVWKGYMFSGWGMSLDFGAYIAMTMPACFYKIHKCKREREKLIWILVIALSLAALYFTMARGAVICAIFTVICALIYSMRKKSLRRKVIGVLIGVGVVVIALVIVLLATDTFDQFFAYYIRELGDLFGGSGIGAGDQSGDITSGRTRIWGWFVEYFFENPLFGGGFSVYMDSNPIQNFNNGPFTIYSHMAHNTLFQLIGSCGIFGFSMFLYHIVKLSNYFQNNRKAERLYLLPVLLGYFAMSLLDTIFFKAQFTFLYLTVLLACEAEVRKDECESFREALEKRKKHRRTTAL